MVGSELRVERETVDVGTIGTTSQVNLPGEVVEDLGGREAIEAFAEKDKRAGGGLVKRTTAPGDVDLEQDGFASPALS